MRIRICGCWATILRVASIPSMRGIRTSIKITSGRFWTALAIASIAVGGLADDGDSGSFEDHGESDADEFLVIGDHDPRHSVPSSRVARTVKPSAPLTLVASIVPP